MVARARFEDAVARLSISVPLYAKESEQLIAGSSESIRETENTEPL
jgi:hypothetical protein